MRGLLAARRDDGDDLFTRIGAFLADQGLSPEPAHYSFAYGVLSDPDGPLAIAVTRLIDGGVRLNRQDVRALGGDLAAGSPVIVAAAGHTRAVDDSTARLVADTRAQADGLATMMRTMHAETRSFGHDLAQSAAAMERVPDIAGYDEIARLTGAMLGRIHDAETRLATATSETDALRAKLAEANDSARRDPLTGLPNRRAFDEAFAERDAETGPYCLAVCDVDRFKRINDEHGHGVGDRVLTAIGRTLTEACADHLVVRHGGEEFAILVRGLDLATAAAHLDAARETVAAKRFRNRDTELPIGQVTVSIGVTAVQVDEAAGIVFGRADQLLYAAKDAGRDRVCAA